MGMRGPVFVDVFSGAGGSALGFVWAGFRPLAALDRYRWAVKTYAENIGV
ncbi:MAG TPA: DNA cytosine methyltransferase, partial [Pyrodictium sp.]|nr:DNA cytosine methyltransferase [Pyrodictium sp.]